MGLRKKITDRFGVPKDLVMGAAVLTVTGRSEAYVENYRGIIEYTEQTDPAADKDLSDDLLWRTASY